MLRGIAWVGLLVLPLACSSSSSGSKGTDAGSESGGNAGTTAGNGGSGATMAGGEAGNASGGRASAVGGTASSGAAGRGGGGASSAGGAGAAGRAGSGGAAGGGGAGGASGSAGAGTGGTSSNGGQWVLGYYVGYQINDYPIAQIDWTALTHIAFSPLRTNADRSLNLGFDDSSGNGMADAKALATAAHAHGVKALMMLGGEGEGARIAAAADSAHRTAYVTALLSAMSTLGYDGIDLDWEDSVNLDDLVALAQALRAGKPDIVLSYPGGTVNGNLDPTVDARYGTFAKSLDRFNVQTYNPSTVFAGSGWSSWFSSPVSGAMASTPTAIDDTFQRYAKAGVPKAKLGMGIAFSAMCYTGGISGPRQPTDGTTQQIVGGDNAYPLAAFFAAGSTFDKSMASERKLDTVTEEPYLSLTKAVNDSHCGASTQYITYEDETSIIAKGTFSKQNGYGGIIIWTIQQGYLPASSSGGRAPNALMQALKKGFID